MHIICKNINLKSTLLKKILVAFTRRREDTGTKLITENKVTKTINSFNCLRYSVSYINSSDVPI
jgi:hypothetical protein